MSRPMSNEEAVRVGIYARVSSDAQEARGTIGSQLETLRTRVAAEGDDLVGEFVDDGYSGARLDRPGLDACATPPRPATSKSCGVCLQIAWPALTPIRSSSSRSSPATTFQSASRTPRRSMIPRGACWSRSKA
jgi:hypothetical protein